MIVMGTKGKTASRTKVFGSVAIDVMEKVRNCPVIVVPETAKHNLPKEIVFPTSYKTHFKIRELGYLTDLAKKCEAAIRVLHISTEDKLTDKQVNNKKLLEEYFNSDSSHSIASTSKWFVGSSKSMRSWSPAINFVNAARRFSPPEESEI